MKVAYVLSRYPAVTETFVQAELEALLECGVDVRVYPLRPSERSARVLQQGGANPVASCVRRMGPPLTPAALRAALQGRSGGRGALGRYLERTPDAPLVRGRAALIWPTVCRIGKDVAAWGADHVHAHFAGVPAAAAMAVAEWAGIGASFTAHAFDIYHRDAASLGRVANAARLIVTISEANRAHLHRVLAPPAAERVHVIHCGVDLRRFSPLPPTEGPLLSVARLVPKKGLDVLVEALALLRQRGLRPGCRIVGDGPERARLQALARARGLQDDICFDGVLAPSAVVSALAAARAFVLPCRIAPDGDVDGIPVSLMEAMASGRVVVSTSVSGIRELVEPGVSGLLVPPGDPAALGDALERVLRGHVDVAAFTAAARARVAEGFDVRTNARRLAQLFAAARAEEPAHA